MKQTILFLHSQNYKKSEDVSYIDILRCPVIREVLWDTLCGSRKRLNQEFFAELEPNRTSDFFCRTEPNRTFVRMIYARTNSS